MPRSMDASYVPGPGCVHIRDCSMGKGEESMVEKGKRKPTTSRKTAAGKAAKPAAGKRAAKGTAKKAAPKKRVAARRAPRLSRVALEDIRAELQLREEEALGKSVSEAPLRCLEAVPRLRAVELTRDYADVRKRLRSVESKALVKELRSRQKVIYGADDRVDIYELTEAEDLQDADGVVALVDSGNVSDNGNGTSDLTGQTFEDAKSLCASEPFRTQPARAFCSGFLIDPSFVATAGHCIDTGSLSSARFVFGFEMIDATTARTTMDNTEIYRAIRIIGRTYTSGATDWALVQLDRPVKNHRVVPIRRSGKIPDNEAVHVIGHPSGIPKKFADGANVRENSHADYFVANLDTYGGNSGSPIFRSSNHIVEGILVRGDTDFVWNGSCRVSNVCPNNGCNGEDCTRTTEFQNLVPRQESDCIGFNPNAAAVVKAGGRWKVAVGGMWMLDFGKKSEADKALAIIQHYGMNSQCFVGRPQASMEYFLVNGDAPSGAFAGEDAIHFDRSNLLVERIGGRWKITDGSHWLMDFGSNEAEARQSLSKILFHEFNYICFVGRPNPPMKYFRA